MLVNTYNQQGEKIGQARLPKEIFDVPANSDLVYQVMVSQMANRRQGTAHTKDRSEVRGGGRKPWRQKGTGRARHGSIRSPLWVGGGVTFGPRKERVYKRHIPRKMRKKALCMALSGKVNQGLLLVLDDLKVKEAKTKQIVGILEKLPCYGKSTLIALPVMDRALIVAARNVPNVETIQVKDLNLLDLLSFQYLLMPKESINVIKKVLMKTQGHDTAVD